MELALGPDHDHGLARAGSASVRGQVGGDSLMLWVVTLGYTLVTSAYLC